MDAVQAGFKHSALTLGFDGRLYIAAGLFHHFLDTGGMDTAVGDQALERLAGDFTPDRIEPGQGDRLGRVIDDEVHAGERLNGAYVTPFAADDTAFHLVVRQGHHRNRGLGHLIRGHPLSAFSWLSSWERLFSKYSLACSAV